MLQLARAIIGVALDVLRLGVLFECLDRMIFIGQASLRRAVTEYMNHYQAERNHQRFENRLIHLPTVVPAQSDAVLCRARLGGTLNFYYRNAA